MFGNNFGYGYNNWQNSGGYVPPTQPVQNQQFNRYTPQPQAQAPYDGGTSKPALQVPWVNGEVGAQAYLIAPNSTVLLMDSDNPIFYIKTSDLSGKASIQAFKYEEIKQDKMEGQVAPSTSYVTKEEFEEFKASILNKTEEAKI